MFTHLQDSCALLFLFIYPCTTLNPRYAKTVLLCIYRFLSIIKDYKFWSLISTKQYTLFCLFAGRGQTRTITKTVKNDSFFNFFAPPEGQFFLYLIPLNMMDIYHKPVCYKPKHKITKVLFFMRPVFFHSLYFWNF